MEMGSNLLVNLKNEGAENSAIIFEGSRLSVYYIFLSTKENSTFKGGEGHIT